MFSLSIKNLIYSFCFFACFGVLAQQTTEEIWIDVRTAKEYEQGHLEGAINIPHTEIKQRIGEVIEDKQASVHLYCVTGVRAQIAKTALESLGYRNVVNKGGLKDIQAEASDLQ